jgi:hypothetical protein
MLRALAALSLTILIQKNGNLVVLKQDVVLDTVALRLHEIMSSAYGPHEVISAHNLGLCRASSIELLIGETYYGKYSSQGQSSSRASRHSRMYCKRCVCPPLQNATCISTQDQWHRVSASDVSHQRDELVPVFLVRCSHSCSQECDCGAGVPPGSLGRVQCICYQVVKLHILVLLELFTVLIHFEKTARCCTCLSVTTLWFCHVEGS